jgi:hypothetical protein
MFRLPFVVFDPHEHGAPAWARHVPQKYGASSCGG